MAGIRSKTNQALVLAAVLVGAGLFLVAGTLIFLRATPPAVTAANSSTPGNAVAPDGGATHGTEFNLDATEDQKDKSETSVQANDIFGNVTRGVDNSANATSDSEADALAANIPDGGNTSSGPLNALPTGAGPGGLVPPQPDVDPNTPATIWGYVLTEDNQPVDGALVLVAGTSDSAFSDAKGYYRIDRLRAGNLELRLTAPRNSNYLEPKPQVVALAPGEERGGVNFMLFNEGEFIAGYVRDEAGEPIVGAAVSANLGRNTWAATEAIFTDDRGYFRVNGVTPGRAIPYLRVVHPEYEAETRMNVTAWDGEQVFILKKVNQLTLRVAWAFDGSPVTLYGYRLLRKGFNDFSVDIGRSEVLVDSLDGTVVLENVETGRWHVEVVVLGENNSITDIRGSADFELLKGGENKEVYVEITAGRTLSGFVVDAEGNGIPGAEVEIIPPPRFIDYQNPVPHDPNSAALNYPKTLTSETGFFTYEGMPPGRYTVWVTKDTLRTPKPTDVAIVADRDPDPLEIPLIQGGVIYGKVIGTDGKPVVNAILHRAQSGVNEYTWTWEQAMTDSEGNYRYEGLMWGIHILYVSGQNALSERKNVDLKPGEEYELNFDFSGSIHVLGTVYVGNHPATGGTVEFLRADRSDSSPSSIDASGNFTAQLRPGTYWPRLTLPQGAGESTEAIEIRDQPASQVHDIRVDFANVDILLVFPPDAEFERGWAILEPRDRKLLYRFNRLDMTQEFKRAPGIIAGEYMATFTSRTRTWEGDSGWVQIRSGEENTVVIEVKPRVRGERVGGWEPDQVANTGTTLSFDVTHLLKTKSSIEVLVTYERGRYAVATQEAALLANGSVVSRDTHGGWSGNENWANTYRLVADPYMKEAQYTLNVTLSTDGGTDSAGSIYVTVTPLE